MPLRRARTIDHLYEEVADYDLVLTTDAPLSLALNRRIDRPRIGQFAATPRRLASDEFRPQDDRKLFIDLINNTDLGWKQAAYLLENILGCWDETGDLHAILSYDQFDTPATREALSIIETTDSAHRDLATHSIDEDTDVAVIGAEQFTPLDKQILPENYDVVTPFGDNQFDLPSFHLFDSATAIVDTVVGNVTAENADDVAVIMDRSSEYPALIESAFESNGIPFYGGPGFSDDERIRTYLRLLRTAYADSGTRVADIRPILTHLGVAPSVSDDEKLLHEVDHPDVEPVKRFCTAIGEQTFDDTLATFEEWCGSSLEPFREEMDQLGVLNEPVTEPTLEELQFYLQSFEVPVDRDDAGVLLADATAAAYVDRPVVFYLGMGVDWTHRIPDRPWIDAEAKDREYLRQFQILLQNGVDQYYLVQETSAGKPITPCLYFHDLLDTDFDTFSDLPNVPHTRLARTEAGGFEKEPVNAEPTTIDTLSQSSLSTFVNCPRDYFFDRIVASPDRDYFRKGNLYHDFAELYVNHPDVIEERERAELLDLMIDEMRPFVDGVDVETLRTEFDVGLGTIVDYVSEEPPTSRDYDGYERDRQDNFFANYFDRSLDSPVTEQWFENLDLGGKGKVDLIHAPERLLDYKSGRSKSASKVVDQSSLDPIHDRPNFQAILYLAHHRCVRPDEPLEFAFFHFLDLLDDAITGDPDIDDALVQVSYYPTSFEKYVGRREAFDALRDGVAESNNRRKTLERMGYDAYEAFFDRHGFPDVEDSDELLASDFAATFTEYAKAEVGDYKYVERGTDKALKRLLRIRGRNYFRGDVDAFEEFLDEQIDRINECRESRFPVGEPNYDRVNHRDLIRADD